MLSRVFLLCFAALATAQYQQSQDVYSGPPQPYSFNFDSTDEYGTRLAQQESGDERNTKTGYYSYTDANGVSRRVDYVADETGFHATVSTNEPGTKSSNAADATYSSSADPSQQQAGATYDGAKPVAPVAKVQPVAVSAPATHTVHAASPVVHAVHAVHAASPVALYAVHGATPVAVTTSQQFPFAYSGNTVPVTYNSHPFNFVLGKAAASS